MGQPIAETMAIKVSGSKGLRQKAPSAVGEQLLDLVARGRATRDDHADVTSKGEHRSHHLGRSRGWHPGVDQHRVDGGRILTEGLQCLGAGGGRHHLEAGPVEDILHEPEQHRLVIDDEDGSGGTSGHQAMMPQTMLDGRRK